MGMAIEIPSGILWIAIAIDKVSPNFKLLVVVRKVMIPSGMLWIIKVIIDIIPSWYSLVFWFFFTIISSNDSEKRIPIRKKILNKIISMKIENDFKYENVSGINDKKEIDNMIPAEKAREEPITSLWYWFGI